MILLVIYGSKSSSLSIVEDVNQEFVKTFLQVEKK